MRFLIQRNLSLVALALAGWLLLPALPAEAGDRGRLSHVAPVPQDWQGVQDIWEQILSWFGLEGESGIPGSQDDQQWSHAAGKEDAGPYIDPNGLPKLNGSSGQGDEGTAIAPIGGR